MNYTNWKSFFDDHAPHYMNNGFTRNTTAEADFLVEELRLPQGAAILDIGCGAGRHSVELAGRGYRMTGVDLSPGMLLEARKAATAARVEVNWIECDAVKYRPERIFDAAICLCEGAFGLVGRDEEPLEHDMAILRNISAGLKTGGRFILTTLNAYAKLRSLTQQDVESGRFDPVTMVEHYIDDWELPEGKKRLEAKERRYLPFELQKMCADAGLAVEQIWGGTAGNWKRGPIRLDEIEIMVTAVKK